MAKREYVKEDWITFRKEILELVILYGQIKEYSAFDKEKIQYIKSFFYLSRNNAIAAFIIKLGFILEDGTPTIRNFLAPEDIQELRDSYEPKIKRIRNKFYAHNNKSAIPNLKITDSEVDDLYNKIILMSEKIDAHYEDCHLYSWVANSEGIKSIEHIIDGFNDFYNLKETLIKTNLKGTIKMDITGQFILQEE